MAPKVEVEITRTCLSFLMRDNSKSDGDQEGFLFGEVKQVNAQDISDQAVGEVTETTVIKITSHMCMVAPCSFYSGVGKVDEEKILHVLGPFKDKVVGYFDFKREYPPEHGTTPTFRFTSLFSELGKWVTEKKLWSNQLTPQPITLMILRQFHSENKAILNNTHCFWYNNGSNVEKIGSKIPNLGDTSHRQYVDDPPIQNVDEILRQSLGSNLPSSNPSDIPAVKVHKAMMAEIKTAGEAMVAAETRYGDSLARLTMLRQQKQVVAETIAQILTLKERGDEGSNDLLYLIEAAKSLLPTHPKVRVDAVSSSQRAVDSKSKRRDSAPATSGHKESSTSVQHKRNSTVSVKNDQVTCIQESSNVTSPQPESPVFQRKSRANVARRGKADGRK